PSQLHYWEGSLRSDPGRIRIRPYQRNLEAYHEIYSYSPGLLGLIRKSMFMSESYFQVKPQSVFISSAEMRKFLSSSTMTLSGSEIVVLSRVALVLALVKTIACTFLSDQTIPGPM